MKKFFLPLWIAGAVLLFLYSYTQVDLSLTLSKASVFQSIQKSFQYIGWFERPLSSALYISVFAILFFIYLWTIRLVNKNKIDRKLIWITILSITGVLTLSYNAFSYDLFNYIFDAKIITLYNQNPYLHKALDFPGDPMLSFMHWTHRTYPYGPVWLLLTVPVSFLGSQVFIVTFFLFKILIGSFFILTIWAVERISRLQGVKNPLLPLAVIAFNPFVLSESLVSSHNDIVMMGLFMLGLFYVLSKEKTKGWVLVLLSIGVKFATLLTAILVILSSLTKKGKYLIYGSLFVMSIAVIAASMRTNYQPWYFLYVVPFIALLSWKKFFLIPFIVFSTINVIYYVPYLHTGNWDPPIPSILNALVIAGLLLSIASGIILYRKEK